MRDVLLVDPDKDRAFFAGRLEAPAPADRTLDVLFRDTAMNVVRRTSRGKPLVYRLAYSGDSVRQSPDQLADFQGASEAPISELIRAERVRQLPDRLPIDLDMCPPTASPARTALPTTDFEHNDVIILRETVHWLPFLFPLRNPQAPGAWR